MAETALVVVFPELEALIGGLRNAHTPSGARGMPAHATLIVPFAASDDVDAYAPEVRRALEPFAPFEVRFRATARFADTLYLRPEPAAPLVALTEALVRAFPAFPPYGGAFERIVPHVTVATGPDALLDRAESGLPPFDLTVRVERAWLFEDTLAGWRRRASFPLDARRYERGVMATSRPPSSS